jgi:hypothetical protein
MAARIAEWRGALSCQKRSVVGWASRVSLSFPSIKVTSLFFPGVGNQKGMLQIDIQQLSMRVPEGSPIHFFSIADLHDKHD